MTTTAAAMETFSRYPKLPPELRSRIWHFALCDQLFVTKQYLFPAEPDYWVISEWLPGQARYLEDSAGKGDNKYVRYQAERHHVKLQPTPLSVSHEVRQITLSWLRRDARLRGLEDTEEDGEALAHYKRTFDPKNDLILISSIRIEAFAVAFLDLVEHLDEVAPTEDRKGDSDFPFGLAITETVLRDSEESMTWLVELIDCFYSCTALHAAPEEAVMSVRHSGQSMLQWKDDLKWAAMMDKTYGRFHEYGHRSFTVLDLTDMIENIMNMSWLRDREEINFQFIRIVSNKK